MQERAESGQIRNQLAFLALGALGAVSFLASRQKIELQNVVGTLMLATFLLCVASVIWSEEPTTTMRKLVPLVCSFSLAIGLGPRADAATTVHSGIYLRAHHDGRWIVAGTGPAHLSALEWSVPLCRRDASQYDRN